jgi:m7GpppX diphosphatase
LFASDLTAEHLPLLRNILTRSLATIQTMWGIDPALITAFVHYLPAYYHFHVHFTHLAYDSDVVGKGVGRGHLLTDIISNLELSGTYYAARPLTIILPTNHPLHNKLLAAQGKNQAK